MSAPLSLHQVSNSSITVQRIPAPSVTHPLALLLLSRPVASVMVDDQEATVLEFYGRFWVHEVNGSRTGYFDSETDAGQYLMNQRTVEERVGEDEQ